MQFPTHEEIVSKTLARARSFGRMWEAHELCWCGSPLQYHAELGYDGFIVVEHDPKTCAPPRPLNEWEPFSVPTGWMAL
jgi:hypothetical protein